ncbi:response regulator transcription factor [Sphingobacterium oryzagri]|uniref:Response regulator transcription factor n=1 Tax=Sphingobacterium oryzagri TaxID=3025669 RepID=A0ABY7WFB3_9SPHI|nr:response regulator transcription factor [Sphingobacterium sp. KACC 22765]WDF68302.1 response regulator transcription factor [Sphingobacterium sp. KACC 22765]
MNILIADQSEVTRFGVKLVIKQVKKIFQIFEASTYTEVVDTIRREDISSLFVNYSILDTQLNQAVHTLMVISPNLKVLLLYPYREDHLVPHVLNSGVHGYLSFNASLSDSVSAISSFLRMGKHFSADILQNKKIMSDTPLSREVLLSLLSPKEKEILSHFLDGKETHTIAEALNIKSSTVYTYKFRIFSKLGVRNLVQLSEVIQIM